MDSNHNARLQREPNNRATYSARATPARDRQSKSAEPTTVRSSFPTLESDSQAELRRSRQARAGWNGRANGAEASECAGAIDACQCAVSGSVQQAAVRAQLEPTGRVAGAVGVYRRERAVEGAAREAGRAHQ